MTHTGVNEGMSASKNRDANCVISGDYVRVDLDVEVFKIMQTAEHGGWADGMAAVSGIVLSFR